MKKLLCLSLVLLFVVSCGIITTKETNIIATITARRVGYRIGVRHPDIAKNVLVVANKAIEAKTDEAINNLDAFIKERIVSQIDDLVLRSDIKTLLSLIKIEVDVPISEDKRKFIISIVGDFINGINIALEK